jgi:hypothetical protein
MRKRFGSTKKCSIWRNSLRRSASIVMVAKCEKYEKVSNYRDFVQLDLHRSPAETVTLVHCTKSSVQINNKFCTAVVTGYMSVNLLLPTGTGLKRFESTSCFREVEVNSRCHTL